VVRSRRPSGILLLSCYELGHPPHAVAMPLAFLERAGFTPDVIDLAVDRLDVEKVRAASFVGISVPMHTALRLGLQAAHRIREVNPGCHICFFGHYALLHAETLLGGPADSVLGGEMEGRMVDLVRDLELGRPRRDLPTAAVLERLDFPLPSRGKLPGLDRYTHLVRDGEHALAGYVESSRGCLHHCRHCPIPPVYGGRFFPVPREVVLADIRNQVQAGARHITFGDADFLNGPTHALRIVQEMHAEFPELTFDFTAKVEHVLRERALISELGQAGAIFMVTAVESLSDRVLAILDKGHTRADVYAALGILRDAGIAMRPSLIPFTPWSTRADFVDLLDFAEAEDLIDHIDAVQYTIRLLVPPGSLLLGRPEMRTHLGDFDPKLLSYRWTHPDRNMDALQAELARLVETDVAAEADTYETFHGIRLATGASGRRPLRRRYQRPPRLSEPWFC
jgi:radical SAM superfamily enzyme YgiQ (UPF0313 family)